MLKRVRHLLAIVFESPNWQNKLVGYKKAGSLCYVQIRKVALSSYLYRH
jgi:hypothetical protein